MDSGQIRGASISGPGLVMGYDWERYGRHQDETQNAVERGWSATGVKAIMAAHEQFDAPLTFFVLTRILAVPRLATLVEAVKDHPLVELGQHSHSHGLVARLKSTSEVPMSVSAFINDVRRAQEVLTEATGRTPIGFRAPLGYYEGLRGEPGVLEALKALGIKYISSDARNSKDEFPAPWLDSANKYRQPYWYPGGLLEIPIQGWSDNVLKGMSTRTPLPDAGLAAERTHHEENLAFAVDHGLLYAPAYHPWSIGAKDPEASVILWLLAKCRDEGVPVLNYADVFALAS